jgi:hypothetical protein
MNILALAARKGGSGWIMKIFERLVYLVDLIFSLIYSPWICLLFVVAVCLGWIKLTDREILVIVFSVVLLGMFEGRSLLERLGEQQKQLQEAQDQNARWLEHMQAESARVLERMEAEQHNVKRQQIRDSIVLEGIAAMMPAAPGEN